MTWARSWKDGRETKNTNDDENSKNVKREISIPELITIRDLANRMAEQSSSIIKHLMGMGVTVTLNHTIDSDTAEYLVKEFGHTPLKEKISVQRRRFPQKQLV